MSLDSSVDPQISANSVYVSVGVSCALKLKEAAEEEDLVSPSPDMACSACEKIGDQ